jgi:hypothetical protein
VARILALISICSVLAGCELIADFDRSKIPSADGGPKTNDGGHPIPVDSGSEEDAGEGDAGK